MFSIELMSQVAQLAAYIHQSTTRCEHHLHPYPLTYLPTYLPTYLFSHLLSYSSCSVLFFYMYLTIYGCHIHFDWKHHHLFIYRPRASAQHRYTVHSTYVVLNNT